MADRIDKTSADLIALLRMNARMPVVEIAKKLNVSRATVQNKMNLLERRGDILGYTVKLKPDIESHPVRLFMNISLEAKKEPIIIQRLRGYPEVYAIHHTTGQWDLIAEVRAKTLPSLNHILTEIRLTEGILKTETNLLTDSYY